MDAAFEGYPSIHPGTGNPFSRRNADAYDGIGRAVSVRKLTNGVEASLRRLLWVGNEISQERDSGGKVTKRYFSQGVRFETGANVGNYYYTRDHLGSIHDLTDANGNVRARYVYDPFGRRNKVAGDLDADFGFTGLFWVNDASLWLARFRAYDPQLARWLSRDPLRRAEEKEGPNLFTYVRNNPVNYTDLLGLQVNFTDPEMQGLNPKGCCTMAKVNLDSLRRLCTDFAREETDRCYLAVKYTPEIKDQECTRGKKLVRAFCALNNGDVKNAAQVYLNCLVASQCKPEGPCNPVAAGGGGGAVSGGASPGAAPGAGSGWPGPSLPPDVATALNIIF